MRTDEEDIDLCKLECVILSRAWVDNLSEFVICQLQSSSDEIRSRA